MRRLSGPTAALAFALCLSGPHPLLAQERPVLELSLDEAVKRALDNNLDIKVEGYNPLADAQDVRASLSYYDPFFQGTVDWSSRESRPRSSFQGAENLDLDTSNYNFGLFQNLPTGGGVSVGFNNTRTQTNELFQNFNPSWNSSLSLSVSQPLLQNFRLDAGRRGILVSKKNREITDVQFRSVVVNVLAAVKAQYYDLISAIDNLEAARKSLALAQKFLDENQIKVRVGTMAPLDVVQAQSEVASREEGVIVAENDIREFEDTLKRSIFPGSDPALWDLRIVPTDRPSADPVPVDIDAATKRALETRTDVVNARKAIELADIDVRYTKGQKLPQLDVIGSYGSSGLGGLQFITDPNDPFAPPTGSIPGGYGDALGQVLGFDFPTWTIRFNFSYPILNRSASARAAQARLAREQAETQLRRLEMNVVSEVRTAARAVETNLKRVASTQAARVLQQQRLDAEEKRFAAGMSSNFLVTQAQRDLATAEAAEVRATADYRKSLVTFERVQETGESGGGGPATLSVVTAGGNRLSLR
jgi:outer membrane protein TolC